MKQRVITAVIGLSFLLLMLFLFDTQIVNLVALIICIIGNKELCDAAELNGHKGVAVASVVFATFLLFSGPPAGNKFLSLLLMAYVVFCFTCLIQYHREVRTTTVCYCLVYTFLLDFSFYTLLSLRDIYGAQLGLFYLVLIFGSAWWADAGAYFAGYYFGKHKLCPVISPKKTVEGLIGGLISAMVFNTLLCALYQVLCNAAAPWGFLTDRISIHLPAVFLLSLPLALLGVLGDLCASIVKRERGIKDFGNIFPGHGGIMDRFDSTVFIALAVWAVSGIIPLAAIIS